MGGVTLQIVRDWVLKLNAFGPEALIDYKGPGPQPILTDVHRAVLAQAIEDGPIPAIHGVVRWRVIDLVQWLSDDFQGGRVQADAQPRAAPDGISQAFAASPPPCPGGRAIDAFQKSLPARLDAIGRAAGTGSGGVEVWFADEARIGQKNKITRRWAKRGTRPSAPQDQRTASTYIFGAICPATGMTAGLVLPWCNIEGMGLHLAEIAGRVSPAKHCALLVDQAGWHISQRLVVPANITIVPLPAKCPELNPVENVWQFMRDNWLSNLVFGSYTAIIDHCCDAWNRLADQPWRVMSIGLRQWVPGHVEVLASVVTQTTLRENTS